MYLEKSFKLKLWSKWDDEVADASKEFIKEYAVSPNRFMANPWSLSQIEFVTEISKMREYTFKYDPVSKEYNIPYKEDESIHINWFSCPDGTFELEFYYDQEMKDKEFKIIFCDEEEDDDDDESETPAPVDNPVLVEVF